jgi:O-antigen/teichoic acid export membrane protein
VSTVSGLGAARPSGARRVFGNTVLLSAGQGVGLVSMAIWTIVVARYIGPERYGFYAVAQAVVSILVIFVGLGLDQVMTRDVAQDPGLARPYLRRFALVKVVSGALVLGGYLAVGLAADPTPSQAGVLAIVAALGGAQALNALVMSLLYAQDAMRSYVVAQSTNFVATMVTGIVVIALDGSFRTVLLFSLLSSLVQLGLSSAAAIRRLPPAGPAPEPPPLSSLLRRGAPFALVALITVMHGNLLIILLEATGSSSASVGRFAAAQRIATVFMIVPGMLAQVLLPPMSRAYAEGAETLGGMFDRAYRYVLLLSIPAAAALAAVAPQLLERLYGPEYAAAGDALRILTLVLLSAVVYVVGPALSAMDRQGLVARIHGANLAVVALAAYALIPEFGAQGAAWALVAGAVAASVVYSRLMFRRLGLRFPVAWTLKTIAAAAVVGGACLAVAERLNFVVVLLLVAPVAFLGSLIVLRTLDASDWQYVRGIVLPARSRVG